MGVCKIKSIHKWKGKTVRQTLFDVLEYAVNQKKTTLTYENNKQKILVARYQCEENASDDWTLLKKVYAQKTGRNQGESDVLAYRIIQSFDPGENVDPEIANKIGYEMAMQLTGGEFQFVIGTHMDKKHIHNHIVINSTALEATHKYRDIKGSFEKVLKDLNDDLCKKYGLSVLEGERSGEKTKYIHWLNKNFDKRVSQEDRPTWQNILREVIDFILGRESRFNVLGEAEQQALHEKLKERAGGEGNDLRPKDLNEFLEILKSCGYEVKGLENKYISVRAKGQKRFTRLNAKTLGEEYTKNNLIDFIDDYNTVNRRETVAAQFENPTLTGPHLNKIIDVKNNKKAQTSVGYERWAKIQNLKTLADTHSYLVENNLSFNDIMDMVSKKENEVMALENQKSDMQSRTERQKEIGVLQNHLIGYVKNRKAYEAYKKSGYSKTFKTENAEALEVYDRSRKYFDEYKAAHHVEKLPTMQELKNEYAELREIKSCFYDELKARKKEMKLLRTLKTNAMELLGVDENGGKTKTEKEIKLERKELIKAQKERLAKERKKKSRDNKFR